MIKLILYCIILLIKYIRSTEDACPKHSSSHGKITKLTPSNIPFTLVSITLADVAEENTTVEMKSDAYQFPNSYIERYIKYRYYVASIEGEEKSFVFGGIDFTNMETFFDGIIYVNSKLHFVEQIQEWQSFNATVDFAGKSALPDKWGMRRWVEERKYLYYTEDDIEPLSHINDSIEVPIADGKQSLFKQLRQMMDIPAEIATIKKVCSVNVLLDSYFMENVVNYNIKQAIHEVIILYGSLDFLYRMLDFADAGKPNHFGFQIAKITVIMRSNNHVTQSKFPLAGKYMNLISSISLGDDRCLGVSFTYQYLEGVAGRAFQGSASSGIFIDRKDVGPITANRNIAYVNYMLPSTNQIMVRGSILNTLAHEVGHTFGAIHEENTRCTKSKGSLMATHLEKVEGYYFKISPCNVNLMKHHITARIDKFLKCPHKMNVYDNLVYQEYKG
ncbi:unnamed protein product [Gordionus sp. m RMFG-2023]